MGYSKRLIFDGEPADRVSHESHVKLACRAPCNTLLLGSQVHIENFLMPPRRKTTNTSAPQSSAENVPESAEFVLSSIRDPHNPKHCGTCLNGAFIEGTAADWTSKNIGRDAKSSKHNSKFWNGIVAFLLLKRKDKQLDRLLTRLSECSCRKDDLTIGRFHEKGSQSAWVQMARMHMEGESGALTSNRCAFIINIFCVLSSLIHNRGVTSVAKGTSQSWPCNPTDLIPYGADSFVESMLQWYRFVPDTIIFHMTGLVLRICETLVIPSLVKYRFSHAVAESCRQLVDLTMADLTEDLDEQGRLRLIQRFHFRVIDYAVYFQNVHNLNKTMSDCYGELMRGCETKVMQLCSIILYLSSDPKMPPRTGIASGIGADTMNEFVVLGQSLFRFFHMHLYPRPDMPVYPAVERLDSNTFPIPASVRDPAQTALIAIHTFRTDRHCSAHKCSNSFQSAGKDFQRCARCKVVSYCGRECQINAWKEPKFPHRQTCSGLRSLIKQGGGEELFLGNGAFFTPDFPRILANWNKAEVHEDELLLIGDWHKEITEGRGYPMPDGTEWTPGYDDYNELIETLSMRGRGPKAKFLNRLARWPSEVAKEERLLKAQAFWGEDIDC